MADDALAGKSRDRTNKNIIKKNSKTGHDFTVMGKRLIYAEITSAEQALIADRIQCWFITVLSPGGRLGIFTDSDQWSIFLGFEFREPVFFWILDTAAVFFGLLNKVFHIFSSIFWGPVSFTSCFNNHGSPLLSYHE